MLFFSPSSAKCLLFYFFIVKLILYMLNFQHSNYHKTESISQTKSRRACDKFLCTVQILQLFRSFKFSFKRGKKKSLCILGMQMAIIFSLTALFLIFIFYFLFLEEIKKKFFHNVPSARGGQVLPIPFVIKSLSELPGKVA